MTTKIRAKNSKGMELNGNILSGDTFQMRDYIKSYLDGKWNPGTKTWTVNPQKVESLLNTPGAKIVVDNSNTTPIKSDGFKVRHGADGWCDKCHSYCYGDCEAN